MNLPTVIIWMSVILSRNKMFLFTKESMLVQHLFYIYWFELYCHNVPLNYYEGIFFLKGINGIQGINKSGQ